MTYNVSKALVKYCSRGQNNFFLAQAVAAPCLHSRSAIALPSPAALDDIELHCKILHNVELHCKIIHNVELHCKILHDMELHCKILHNT